MGGALKPKPGHPRFDYKNMDDEENPQSPKNPEMQKKMKERQDLRNKIREKSDYKSKEFNGPQARSLNKKYRELYPKG